MTFFDKKEEVLDIELTQYGKYLLSKGKFKPAYYEFFDDDVVYDVKYTSDEIELQKDIQVRIKDAVRPHTQYNFVSSEDDLRKQMEQVRSRRKGSFADIYVPYSMKHRVMSMPLAKSELGNDKKPSWNIRTFKNKFVKTDTYVTGSYSNLKIPRLNLEDIEFKVRAVEENENKLEMLNNGMLRTEETAAVTSDMNSFSTRFPDKTFLQVEQNYILLDLREMNVPFEKENFEIEIYEISQDETGIETLKQLYFNKEQQSVVNNILVEDSPKGFENTRDKPEIVSNYFMISVDREINSTVLCANLTDEEKKVLNATNQMNIECEESYVSLGSPRIKSDVTPNDLGENC